MWRSRAARSTFPAVLCLLTVMATSISTAGIGPHPARAVVPAAADALPVRGQAEDLWADAIVGQPDFGEITPDEVTGTRLFNPGGVLVDRSVRPNRVYVYDGGNSRVLGLSHLGFVTDGPHEGEPCTSDSDYPGSTCGIVEGIGADLVLGQPSFTTSACNGDSNFQRYPARAAASAATLCTLPEGSISPLEGGSFANMAVDANGNLFVPDWENHRVLRYDSPYEDDTLADDVWGQADFTGNACNQGRGIGAPDAESLCLSSPTNEGFVGGVGLDSSGNLWITDNSNNRVLRFPVDPGTSRPGRVADLVLGQPDFTSWQSGTGMNQLHAPAAVRVSDGGSVYVADSLNGRILIFDPPFSSGMEATGILGSGFRIPTGLEFDPGGGIWVSDRINNQLLLFVDGEVTKVLLKDVKDDSGTCGGSFVGDGPDFYYEGNQTFFASFVMCDPAGSIGIDTDGNVIVSGSSNIQDMWRFPAPLPDSTPGIAHSADARIFVAFQFGAHNHIGQAGIFSARGVAVAKGQLIVADAGRLLFWNDPPDLANGQTADGFVGAASHQIELPPFFGRIREDRAGRLWVIRGAEIQVFSLPLTTGTTPFATITPPVPVLGGGSISWDDLLVIGGIAPTRRGRSLWVADPDRHRVFRIRDPLTDPLVDVVLGQTDPSGTDCNQGRGPGSPSQDSLCYPGSVVLDTRGNVWVSDHALEVAGNFRLLEFNAKLFRGKIKDTALFAVPASRVLGTNGSFTGSSCQDALCGPWEPAFSFDGHLVVGLNAWIGSRFPLFYADPLDNDSVDGFLNDFHSMGYAATFDDDDNLYVADLNRDRVLIYLAPFSS